VKRPTLSRALRRPELRIQLALALTRVPPRPAREVEDGHVDNASRPIDQRIVAVGAAEECFRLAIDPAVAEGRVDLAERKPSGVKRRSVISSSHVLPPARSIIDPTMI